MFCGQCGTRLGAGDAFCPECGAPVGGAVPEKKRRGRPPKAKAEKRWERKMIATGLHHTLGLKNDGTVLAVGENNAGQCDISDWRDIVAIATDYEHTVGLKSNGTVLAVGNNDDGQCEVSDWRDIKLP